NLAFGPLEHAMEESDSDQAGAQRYNTQSASQPASLPPKQAHRYDPSAPPRSRVRIERMEQYRTMKKRAFLAGSAALLASGAARAQGWADYRNEEGNFHVEMPGAPKLNTADIPIGNK